MNVTKRFRLLLAVAATGLLAVPLTASASNSWSSYHWERTTEQVELVLGDNLSGTWSPHLNAASSDWNVSAVIETTVAPGSVASSACGPDTGEIEVCADNYGETGWLGIAGIWTSRGKNKHITRGYVQLNDFYFNSPAYNTSAWRQLVTCQEVGHTFGLAHQDESFTNANLGTCMDYTSDPTGNTQPNQHDYDQLAEIYSHDHGSSDDGGKVGGPPPGKGKPSSVGAEHSEWGRAVHHDPDGRPDVFELDLRDGSKLITHVTWAR